MFQSEELKKDLILYLDFLLSKQFSESQLQKRVPKFGSGKGMFKMASDFDAPLEDFKEYM
ncbi:DUF2281 domain-containing protein [Emticicia fontis]